MAESLLYITFKDTVSTNDAAGQKIAIDNIVAQLVAAAERIQADPKSVFSYLRQDQVATPVKPKEVVSEPVTTAIYVTARPVLTEEDMMNIVFKEIKRTHKSESIVRYLVQNSGTELTIEQLTAGASINRNDLSSWLAQTGSRIAAITKPSRGVYKFNPDKLTIT
jgi:hypothetical protein